MGVLCLVLGGFIACERVPNEPPSMTFFDHRFGDGFLIVLPSGEDFGGSPEPFFRHLVRPRLIELGWDAATIDEGFWIPSGRHVSLPEPDLPRLIRWLCASPEAFENLIDRQLCRRAGDVVGSDADSLQTLIGQVSGLELQDDLQAVLQDLAKAETELYFPQVVRDVRVGETDDIVPVVPIEHSGIFAIGREGERFHLIQGRLFPHYEIANRVVLSPEEAIEYSMSSTLGDRNCLLQDGRPTRSDLLLLPVGSANGVPQVRFAYRLQTPVSQCWIDAEDGTTLFDDPLIADAVGEEAANDTEHGTASIDGGGEAYHRSPSSGGVRAARFAVAPWGGGKTPDAWGLEHDGILRIVPPEGVAPLRRSNRSSSDPWIDFTVSGISSADGPQCLGEGEQDVWDFLQADLYATLYRHISTVRAAGIFSPFPDPSLNVELVADRYRAEVKGDAMRFGFDPAAQEGGCPEIADKRLGASQDHTVVAHELGHLITRRLTSNRPADWCHPDPANVAADAPPCPVPNPLDTQVLHDYADAWANTLEGTPCWGDWAGRNLQGVGQGEACRVVAERASSMPRLARVAVPFDPQRPRNHFPEDRCPTELPWQLCGDLEEFSPRGPYGDGQLAATALWELRRGLAARAPMVGRVQFLVRLNRAVRHLGWSSWQCGSQFDSVYQACDQEVYTSLVELEFQLARQWADALSKGPSQRPGAELFNEITAAFAKIGVFLIPARELVAAQYETSPRRGDAVIDIAMPRPPHDDTAQNEVPPEDADGASWAVDFFAKGDHLLTTGPAPVFQVWTGPRYQLNTEGQAWVRQGLDGAPCNRCYQVEVASDAAFEQRRVVSPWQAVNTDPLDWSEPQCYGEWQLPASQWQTLATGQRLYYRVTTHTPEASGECAQPGPTETVRRSTEPGNGLWRVPPPSARLHRPGEIEAWLAPETLQ